MSVRHRWLLLSILVAAVVVALAVVGSRQTVDRGVTISFLGYTNLPNANAPSAMFVVRDEHPAVTHFGAVWVDVEGSDGYKSRPIEVSWRTAKVPVSKEGDSFSFPVDVPLESCGWRLSLQVYHSGLRRRLLLYAAAHGLLRQPLLGSLSGQVRAREQSNSITNSSIWLTNSPSDQKQP